MRVFLQRSLTLAVSYVQRRSTSVRVHIRAYLRICMHEFLLSLPLPSFTHQRARCLHVHPSLDWSFTDIHTRSAHQTKNTVKKREMITYSEIYGASWDGVTEGMEVRGECVMWCCALPFISRPCLLF